VPDTLAESAALRAQVAELRDLLRRCAATRTLADGTYTPIEGGLSNQAWRLDAGGDAWFVRRGHPDALRLGVDRRSECVVLHAVSAAGLAPDVLVCDPPAGLLVTRFIEGRPWQVADIALGDNLRRVAARLRVLHGLEVPSGVQRVDYARQARHLEAGLPAADGLTATLRQRAALAFARINARGCATALCHHDLHHLNLLDDGADMWLVDWEYGGRGDPLLDVAGFLAMHDLGPGPTEAFLKAYGRLGPADLECLGDARWAFDYVQWLWYRSRFAGAADGAAGRTERLAQRLLRCNN
jgi:thiamine kinase-like enzyme